MAMTTTSWGRQADELKVEIVTVVFTLFEFHGVDIYCMALFGDILLL